MDLSRIRLSAPVKTAPVEPEQIFNSLTLRGSINNIWEPQNKAVAAWFDQRNQPDVAIEMATGGGKTLVGLLVGQSTVNEMQKPGLYVCPTIQLAEQTRKLARETGFGVASYLESKWDDADVYDEARGLCITNYAAVFNGHPKLAKAARPGVVVFDDAHVAGEEVRRQFTLRIPRSHAAFAPLMDLVRPHFRGAHEAAIFDAIVRNVPMPPLFLPQYELRRVAVPLRHILQKFGVDRPSERTWLVWGHVGTRLEACAFILDHHQIEIAPPVPPVRSVWCMRNGIRRIYLTATLPSASEFARTFGIRHLPVIRPEGKLGTAQRLFVLPQGDSDAEQRQEAKRLIAKRKACIIVPAKTEATQWSGPDVTVFESDDRHEEIVKFANATAPAKLVLAARYHGIDLPGDACRILLIDGLPRGFSLMDRFLTEVVQAESLRASQTAVRVIQAIGRIFRSNTDHGAVILCTPALQRWIKQRENRALFPPLIQQQLAMAIALRKDAVDIGHVTNDQLLEGVLVGDKAWDDLYKQSIGQFDAESPKDVPTWLVEVSAREHEAYTALWDGNAAKAATDFLAVAEDADQHDPDLAAWYRHWAASSHQEMGEEELAATQYLDAANRRAGLGRPSFNAGVIHSKSAPAPSEQARAMTAQWSAGRTRIAARLRNIAELFRTFPIRAVHGEEALAELGTLLGLDTKRPDTKAGGNTGPDVSWRPQKGSATLGLELKTEKIVGSEYRKKDDVGQAHDHVQWAAVKYPGEEFSLIWVGPILPVSRESHPPQGLRVIEPSAFVDLAERALMIYEGLAAGSDETDEVTVERYLRALGLRWPECWRSLPSTLAMDLQMPAPEALVV